MKRKIAIFNIFVLSFFLVFLVKIEISSNTQRSKFVNKTIEIKEKLLNKVADGRTLQGKIYIENANKNLDDVEVVLYKEENGKLKKSSITYTDKKGNFKFTNLLASTYSIGIEENEEYRTLNSNSFNLDSSINDLNLQVVERGEFKAEIKKYIKEIKLINNGEETNYYYTKENNTVLPLKNIKNLNGEVVYEFEVKNIREVSGYVKVIKDKLPEGLSFDGKKNIDWKEKNGYLYTSKLSEEEFSANQMKTITLTLDIENTNEARTYLNKVSITGEVYHRVTYMNQGQKYKELDIVDGDLVTKESDIEMNGYKFTGWYKDKNCTKKFNFNEPITEDKTIYAGWKKEIKVTYIVNGNTYKEETYYEKDKAVKPTDPEIEGYQFISWYIADDYTEEYDFDTLLTDNITLYGKLEQTIVNYTVKYMVGDSEYSRETLQAGTLIENKTGPAKSDVEKETRVGTYTFDGWYDDEEFETPHDFTNGISKDTILYGKYNENLVCKNRDNVVIPTKEEIINSLNISKINITNTTENNGKTYANNFIAEYDLATDTYSITGYDGNYPSDLLLPDKINGKDVISIADIGNGQTFNSVKISSSIKTIVGSFNGATITSNLDFNEAINLTTINQSFQGLNVDRFDLGNSINLTSISNMQSITCDTFDFGNVLSLESIGSNALNGLSTSNLDFGNAVNLSSIGYGNFNNIELNVLNLSKLFSLENISMLSFLHNDSGAKTYIKKIILNPYLKNIGRNAFYGTGVQEIDFECAKSTLEVIDAMAFGDNQLQEVILKDFPFLETVDLTAFGMYSFGAENSKLEKFVLKNLSSLVNVYQNGPTFKMNPNSENSEIIIDNIGSEYLPKDQNNSYSLYLFNETNARKISIINNANLKELKSNTVASEYYADIKIENNPSLEFINAYAFKGVEKNISFKNLPNLKEFKNNAVESYYGDVELVDLPSLEKIGSRAFSSSLYGDLISYTDTKVTIKNLPSLVTIADEAFMGRPITNFTLENLPSLTTIGSNVFHFSVDTTIYLTGDNVPSLKSIGSRAFSSGFNTSSIPDVYISLVFKDLEDFNQINLLNNLTTVYIDTLVIDNLPQLTTVGSSGGAPIRHLTIKNCENLTSNNFTFSGRGIESLELDNLPQFTKIQSYDLTSNIFKNLDLTKLQNLQEIQSGAFSNNTNLTTLKLPESLTTIGDNAFSGDENITCIEIQGDNTRFNDRWESIGLSASLSPSTCVFMDEERNNLLSNIFNLGNEENEVYNILLYKMDDESLIDNSKKYTLQRLVGEDFEELGLKEDLENVGNYIIDSISDDEAKAFNNKIYISNIKSGTYRLVEKGTNKTLTFIIENNGDITGYAKVSNSINNINVISSSEAEFTTIIQTGIKRLNYLLILLTIILSLFIIVKKKKKLN